MKTEYSRYMKKTPMCKLNHKFCLYSRTLCCIRSLSPTFSLHTQSSPAISTDPLRVPSKSWNLNPRHTSQPKFPLFLLFSHCFHTRFRERASVFYVVALFPLSVCLSNFYALNSTNFKTQCGPRFIFILPTLTRFLETGGLFSMSDVKRWEERGGGREKRDSPFT